MRMSGPMMNAGVDFCSSPRATVMFVFPNPRVNPVVTGMVSLMGIEGIVPCIPPLKRIMPPVM